MKRVGEAGPSLRLGDQLIIRQVSEAAGGRDTALARGGYLLRVLLFHSTALGLPPVTNGHSVILASVGFHGDDHHSLRVSVMECEGLGEPAECVQVCGEPFVGEVCRWSDLSCGGFDHV